MERQGSVARARRHGPHVAPDGVSFRLWAPTARSIDLLEVGRSPLAMACDSEGWYQGFSQTAQAGTRYRFRINDDLIVPDPASFLQPDGRLQDQRSHRHQRAARSHPVRRTCLDGGGEGTVRMRVARGCRLLPEGHHIFGKLIVEETSSPALGFEHIYELSSRPAERRGNRGRQLFRWRARNVIDCLCSLATSQIVAARRPIGAT